MCRLVWIISHQEPGFLPCAHAWNRKFMNSYFNEEGKGKVKCILVQALMLCTGRMAHRGCRGIALPFHVHGTRRGWGVMARPLSTPGKDLIPILQETGWSPGLVWTGAENLAPTGIWSPDRPTRSQSLYWICYPAHSMKRVCRKFADAFVCDHHIDQNC